MSALRSDPESFWETVDQVSAYEDAYWITFAGKLTEPDGSRMFILEHDEGIGGFVYGAKKPHPEYRVGGLWVEPTQRERGYGSALVQQVVAWARADSDEAVIRLWCPVGPTERFYESNGFRLLDRFRTNDLDGRRIVEMEWGDERRS